MYADKDKSGLISMMEISQEDAKDLGSCLFEFEIMLKKYSSFPERERARLALFSAKIRFLLIEALQ